MKTVRIILYSEPSISWASWGKVICTVHRRKVFFGDSGDAGILASRFLIKILKSSETQN